MAKLLKKAGDFVLDVAAQQYKRSMTRKLNAFGELLMHYIISETTQGVRMLGPCLVRRDRPQHLRQQDPNLLTLVACLHTSCPASGCATQFILVGWLHGRSVGQRQQF